MLNFKIDTEKIDQIGSFSKEEREFRIKNLNYFNEVGFPNKRLEDWKFSDLREIVSKILKICILNLSNQKIQKLIL